METACDAAPVIIWPMATLILPEGQNNISKQKREIQADFFKAKLGKCKE